MPYKDPARRRERTKQRLDERRADAAELARIRARDRTGKVRGLLCHDCNHAIGKMRDDPKLLRRAARYLERSRGEDARARQEALPWG